MQVSAEIAMKMVRKLTKLERLNLVDIPDINDTHLLDISSTFPRLQHLKVSAGSCVYATLKAGCNA